MESLVESLKNCVLETKEALRSKQIDLLVIEFAAFYAEWGIMEDMNEDCFSDAEIRSRHLELCKQGIELEKRRAFYLGIEIPAECFKNQGFKFEDDKYRSIFDCLTRGITRIAMRQRKHQGKTQVSQLKSIDLLAENYYNIF